MQKIIYASESTIPSAQANSVQVMQMCNAFAQAGHEVTLFAGRSENKASSIDLIKHYGVTERFAIKTLALHFSLLGRIRYALQVAVHAKHAQVDLLYARCAYSALASCSLKIPTMLELHSLPAAGSRPAKSILPRIFKNRSLLRVICITQSLKNDLISQYQLTKSRVAVFPDGANPVSQTALQSSVLSLAEKIGTNQPLIGYLGSLYPGKGMEVIVPLAAKLPRQQFVVIGGDQEGLEYWRRQAVGLANIHFIGRVSPAEAAAYSNQFAIALVPNQRKVAGVNGTGIGEWTSPLKLFEYMALGKPILASRIPVLEEVLVDGKNCLLCDPTDINDWVAKTNRLLTDAVYSNQLGSRARRDFEKNYSWHQRAINILQILC